MSALVTIALITLILAAATVFITFCIYSQERSNHLWLVSRSGRGFHGSETLAIGGPDVFGDCNVDCQLEQCRMLNANGQFAMGLRFVSKLNQQDDSPAEVLQCVADSFFGLSDFDAAAKYYLLAHKQSDQPNEKILIQLSRIYSNVLQQPNTTIALLQPLLVPQEVAIQEDGASNDASVHLRANLQLSCAYLQALTHDPEHSQQMLQYLESLRRDKIPFDDCILYAQHQVYTARRYFADAYQASAEFVRDYPALHQAHTAMGEALLALQRTGEATAVLKVAHSLLNPQELRTSLTSPLIYRNATLDALLRLGSALYVSEALSEAERVLDLAIPLMHPTELAQQCAVLSLVGQLHLKTSNYAKAYVALLQCTKHCPLFAEGFLRLGIAQHKLGLLHDATTSLKKAARSKSLKTQAKAQMKAVKATDAAHLAKQAKEDEDKLGPQPPLDPNVKRQEPNGLYIDFLARMQKEREEKEAQARAATTVEVSPDSSFRASTETTSREEVTRATEVAAGLESDEPVIDDSVSADQVRHVADTGADLSGPASPVSSPLQASMNSTSSIIELKTEMASPIEASVSVELSSAEASARALADQYIAMAMAYAKTNPDQALKTLKGAIKKAPHYAEPYMVRANVHLIKGDVTSARDDLLKIFSELDKNNSTCAAKLHEIATHFVRSGQVGQGQEILTQLGNFRPKDERSCMELAVAFAEHGEFNLALIAVFSIDPSLPHTTERVKLTAQIHELSGFPIRAAEALYVGIHNNLTTYTDLGEMYMRSGNQTMAIRAFESSLAIATSALSLAADSADPSSAEEVAFLHRQLAQAHLALHEESELAAQEEARDSLEDVELGIDTRDGDASVESPSTAPEAIREHLVKAHFHYAAALQTLGLSESEVKKLLARYSEDDEERDPDSENTSMASSSPDVTFTHTIDSDDTEARPHRRSRWFSRRSAESVAEHAADDETTVASVNGEPESVNTVANIIH